MNRGWHQHYNGVSSLRVQLLQTTNNADSNIRVSVDLCKHQTPRGTEYFAATEHFHCDYCEILSGSNSVLCTFIQWLIVWTNCSYNFISELNLSHWGTLILTMEMNILRLKAAFHLLRMGKTNSLFPVSVYSVFALRALSIQHLSSRYPVFKITPKSSQVSHPLSQGNIPS